MRRLELLEAPKPHMPIGQLDSALEHSFHWKFAEWKAQGPKAADVADGFVSKCTKCRSTSSLHKVQLLEIQVTLVARNILVRGVCCEALQSLQGAAAALECGPWTQIGMACFGKHKTEEVARSV